MTSNPNWTELPLRMERNFATMLGSVPAINALSRPLKAYMSKTLSGRMLFRKTKDDFVELQGGIIRSGSKPSDRGGASTEHVVPVDGNRQAGDE